MNLFRFSLPITVLYLVIGEAMQSLDEVALSDVSSGKHESTRNLS